MFTKRINPSSAALSTQFEGTPGVYAKRDSPPQIPPTTAERPLNFNKDSRSLSSSHVSLIRNRVDSSTHSINAAIYSTKTSVISTATPEITAKNEMIRRLSHTPQQTQRKAVPRHELSSHSFNVPHSSSSSTAFYPNNNTTQRRYGKPASLENAQNSQDSDNAHFIKGRLGPSFSFGNFIEPLILQPIAMQSVYAASSRSGTNPNNTPEQWKHLYGGGNMIEATNFIFANDSDKLDLDKLPPGWEIALTADCVRYYIDHNNGRTHWIHPLAPENLAPGWTKIFDKIHGVVYYNHIERRSQFEHPGLAASSLTVGQMLPTIHGSISLQSVGDEQDETAKHAEIDNDETDDDLNNIINNEDVPEWLKLYSQAPFSSDHLLNFNLFRLTDLEHFDKLIMKLYKAEIVDTVRKYDRAMSEIDNELSRRHSAAALS